MTHPTAPRVTSHTPRRDIPTGSSRPPAGRRRGGGDTRRTDMFVIAVGIAAAVAALAVLIAGLCRAAADTKDVEPDAGEYK